MESVSLWRNKLHSTLLNNLCKSAISNDTRFLAIHVFIYTHIVWECMEISNSNSLFNPSLLHIHAHFFLTHSQMDIHAILIFSALNKYVFSPYIDTRNLCSFILQFQFFLIYNITAMMTMN
jgi:hypothetical protein